MNCINIERLEPSWHTPLLATAGVLAVVLLVLLCPLVRSVRRAAVDGNHLPADHLIDLTKLIGAIAFMAGVSLTVYSLGLLAFAIVAAQPGDSYTKAWGAAGQSLAPTFCGAILLLLALIEAAAFKFILFRLAGKRSM